MATATKRKKKRAARVLNVLLASQPRTGLSSPSPHPTPSASFFRSHIKTLVFLSLSSTHKNTKNILQFHRIIRDFMIQGGDPTGTGRGGESIFGGKFADEIQGRALYHTGAGVLAMANSGPNTNGSQFFITLAPAPFLDGKHTIFGRVCAGMEVVKRIGAVATDAQDRPTSPLVLSSARVVSS